MIAEIKQNYLLKRIRAEEECENFISNLKQDKYFADIYTDYYKKNIEYLKSKYEKENLELKNELSQLKSKIDSYLKANHINSAKLTPHYDCPICKDTGMNGGKICACVIKELNKKLSTKSSSQTKFHSFNELNKNLMDDTEQKAYAHIIDWCKKYPEKINKININIVGPAGCGKTFMMECVANELIERGYLVCFKTMFELNELARLYHIGKSYEFSDCMKADVLLIDDLGTEPILRNVTKEYLYNIINTRQINNLVTIISTNLSPDDILDRYDERIFSRLTNKNLCLNIQLNPSDKRIIENKKNKNKNYLI